MATCDDALVESMITSAKSPSSADSIGSQKRQFLRIYELFKGKFQVLSSSLHCSLQNEKKLLQKCAEMKSALVINASKLQAALNLRDEDAKSIEFYQEECELAWKEAHLAKMREEEALRIIETLNHDVLSLKGQLNVVMKAAEKPDKNGKAKRAKSDCGLLSKSASMSTVTMKSDRRASMNLGDKSTNNSLPNV